MLLATADWVLIANLATPLVCGAVGYLVKRAISDMDRRIGTIEAEDKATEQAQAKFVAEHRLEHQRLVADVVGKEDWLRESGLARQRQEKIIEDLSVLKGRQDAGIEIASAIAAALNRRDANG